MKFIHTIYCLELLLMVGCSNRFMNYYWIAKQWNYPPGSQVAVATCTNGNILAWVSPIYKDALYFHGTGQLSNGRLINCMDDICSCFEIVDYPIGSKNNRLSKFTSIADSETPFGTKLYIPKLNGFHLPNGKIHNGCVQVDDECTDCLPGTIKLFTKEQEWSNPFRNLLQGKTNIEFDANCILLMY